MGSFVAKVRVVSALAVLLITGCAGVPFDAPKEASHAGAPSRSTAVFGVAEEWFARADGTSGFVPLASGEEALGARLRLIDAAEQSIDMQYFLMKPDMAAALVSDSVIRAAERGVRVRILLDDVFTTASDAELAILDAKPNIEVRLYNPVARAGPKWLSFLGEFPRVNRRMHNKAFVVDNAIAIVGGRNIADEYYAIEQDIEFADFDLLAAGPVAVQVSKTFDEYWNSKRSVELKALLEPEIRNSLTKRQIGELAPAAELARGRQIYDNAIGSSLFSDLAAGKTAPMDGRSMVVSDPPAKLGYAKNSGLDHLFKELAARMAQAKEEVIIISPYFVPRREGVAFLESLRSKGVQVAVITNSLASNNHAYVHGGYFPYREELLKAGVRLYEAKADAAVSQLTGEAAHLTLHTKAVVIDRRTVFVGSMNIDPRSIEINSEMGVFVDSEDLGNRFAEAIEGDLEPYAYSVELDESGSIYWRYGAGQDGEIWRSEPGASFWRKLIAVVAAILPMEGQL